jgi:hypothetical protein
VRCASASLVAIALAGCVSPPPPLPPRRTMFTQPAPPMARPADLQTPTTALRHERYMVWTLLADFATLVPLVSWMGRPDDVYLAAPSLAVVPLIHVLHGEHESAGISLVMRGAMVGLVYLAGRNAREECEDELICVPIGSVLISQAAIIPTILIDSLFLARREREVPGWRRMPIVPSVGVTRDGGGVLTLGGEF